MRTIILCICIVCTSVISAQSYSQKPFKLPAIVNTYVKDMVLLEGGTYTKWRHSEFTPTKKDSNLLVSYVPVRVTVASFYISNHEVTNAEYREFVKWVEDSIKAAKVITTSILPKDMIYVFGMNDVDYKMNIFPDTACWMTEFAYAFNDPMSIYYYKHPAYNNYPVVGVSYLQAMAYCHWRTMQLNHVIAKASGHPLEKRITFRLPFEAEWEYAALYVKPEKGKKDIIENRYLYPWSGYKLTDEKGKYKANFGNIEDANGLILKNYMDDNATYTAAIRSYLPNAANLYEMAGNVAEWTADVPITTSFKDSLNNTIQIEYGDDLETAFQKVCKMYLPYNSHFDPTQEDDRKRLYAIAENYLSDAKLIHSQPTSKIVKGGSWASSVIYLQPGSRMVFPEERTSCTIGFRVVMSIEE